MESLRNMSLARKIKVGLLKKFPIKYWPTSVGDKNEIRIPSNVIQKKESSTRGGANINIILNLLEKTRDVEGDIAECGVFRGATIVTTGVHAQRHGKKVFGYDSFEGFDEDINVDLELGGPENEEKKLGGFSQTSYDLVMRKISQFNVEDSVTLVPGFFKKTLSKSSERVYSFVHLDCDIYESYKTCLEYFWPRLSDGGIILFDEYMDPPWPGCKKAVDEFCKVSGAEVQKIQSDNYIKFYVQKKV